MSNDKPVFLCIHSAWMGGWSWQYVTEALRAKGYDSLTPDLPGHGVDKTRAEVLRLSDYVQCITSIIDKTERPVILVGHSFGGIVASQVAEARPEKVQALVYLCAFMLPSGLSFMDAIEGVDDSLVLDNLRFSDDGSSVTIAEEFMHPAVAHDVPEENFLAVKPMLVAEPTQPLAESLVLTDRNFGQIKRFYIECTEDRAIPLRLQRQMCENLSVDHVYQLESSHAAVFSKPSDIAASLEDIVIRNAFGG
ncbi:hypothetical protein BGP75_23720 [Motiliproteus sp. MSK22-1]|nr:hypothetical protein BGP75_23720 [Motiliproteus sp. MSK22-1]